MLRASMDLAGTCANDCRQTNDHEAARDIRVGAEPGFCIAMGMSYSRVPCSSCRVIIWRPDTFIRAGHGVDACNVGVAVHARARHHEWANRHWDRNMALLLALDTEDFA